MVRTAVNVTGDATVSTVVAYHEGQLDEVVFNDPNADLDMEGDDDSAGKASDKTNGAAA